MKIQRICLVDDAKGMRAAAHRHISQSLGKEVVFASNGFEAIDVILSNMPDACFIDVEMPELNGLQLVSILRANPMFDQMPIAMLSSAASIFDRQKGSVVGADLYVTKPFSKDSIAAAISEMEALHE